MFWCVDWGFSSVTVAIDALLQRCLCSIEGCWVTPIMSDLQVRAGEPVSQYEIVKFAQLFNDELTLDNLERIHLVNLCRFVGIQPFGTDAFLVSRFAVLG